MLKSVSILYFQAVDLYVMGISVHATLGYDMLRMDTFFEFDTR